MSQAFHKRRASRIKTRLPTLVQSVGQGEVKLHDNLKEVYGRVVAAGHGGRGPISCTIQDLSTNGAFLTGDSLPLLSRVAFQFRLVNFGPVEVVGWVLWHRNADCTIPGAKGEQNLAKGFGVLFESIPLDARIAIQRLVEKQNADT